MRSRVNFRRLRNDVNQDNTDNNLYKDHIEILKWAYGIATALIVIVSGYVAWLTHNDISDMKKEYATRIKEIEIDAHKKAIERATELVDKEFETRKMQDLIVNVANENLRKFSKNYIDEKTKFIDKQIVAQGEANTLISMATDLIRFQNRKGLDIINNLILNGKNESIKYQANIIKSQVQNNYDEYYSKNIYLSVPFNLLEINRDINKLSSRIMDTINLSTNLEFIGECFDALRKLTDKPFAMFDFESANHWYKKEFPQEKRELQKKLELILVK